MPLFNDDEIALAKHNSDIRPIPPTEPNGQMEMKLDTASVYKDLQYSGEIVIGIMGSPDSVTYYSKLIKGDDLVTNSSDIIDPTILQYKRINNFEIRVTEAPTFTIDDSENTSVVTGTANLYPVLTPKVGDVLVKAILSSKGIWGVFQVTNVERKSMYNEPVWGITFAQIRFSKSIRDLESDKFVFFEYDFLVKNLETGQNPLVPTLTNGSSQNERLLRSDLITIYYNRFYNKEVGTLLVPTEGCGNVYDPFVVKFWNTIIDKSLLQGLDKPTECQITSPFDRKEFLTIFDVYLKQAPGLIWSTVKQMTNLSTVFFTACYLKLTIFATGIDSVIYPHTYLSFENTSLFPEAAISQKDNNINWDDKGQVGLWINSNHPNNILGGPDHGKGITGGPQDTVVNWELPKSNETHIDPNSIISEKTPIVNNSITVNGISNTTYIFSEKFYLTGVGQSLLEVLVLKVINGQSILLKDVYLALEVVKRENIIKQYYHLLFIISLLQVAR